MECLFEKKFIEICNYYGFDRNLAESLFLNKPVLISPTEFLYKLVENNLSDSDDKQHAMDVIEYSVRSRYGYDIYDRCDFFFYMAEKFAQTSSKNVFLVQFDIKSCFKLAKIIPSEDIFRIHNFILGQALEFFKNNFDFVYGIDATRNDDSYFVVGGNVVPDELVSLLYDLQSLLHNSIIRDIKNDDLYTEKPVVTYGFAQLGQGVLVKESFKNIEKAHLQSDKLKKKSGCFQKTIYDYQSLYVNTNPYTWAESSWVKNIYFMPDDYSDVNKERLLIEKIKKETMDGVFVHFKFQNSSGVNKLLISKEFGIIILKHYINILKNLLKEENCSGDIYFVGLNSFILHLYDVKTTEYITNFFNKFNDKIDEHINSKFINDYFLFTGSQRLDDNLKIADIPSKRGLSSGISTINYLSTLSKNIKSVDDLIKFKDLALHTNQMNIRAQNILGV